MGCGTTRCRRLSESVSFGSFGTRFVGERRSDTPPARGVGVLSNTGATFFPIMFFKDLANIAAVMGSDADDDIGCPLQCAACTTREVREGAALNI